MSAIFKTNDPRYVEQVEILNSLYRIYCARPKIEGLFWVLGREQMFAMRVLDAGSPHARENQDGDYELFGLRVYEAILTSVSVLALPAMLHAKVTR